MQSSIAVSAAPRVAISPIPRILDAARNGHMFILVDDEARGHEAYLMMAAQMVTPEAVTFLATHARGLVSLALEKRRIDDLGLPLLPDSDGRRRNGAGGATGLERAHHAVSIEACEGVSTGISAADRARTITVAIDASKTSADITTPGHVFPLVARVGGVLVRAGCTEAAVDIARLAGLIPAGVIAAMLREDGEVAALRDLDAFIEQTGIRVGTIRDLIRYRLQKDRLVQCVAEVEFDSTYGGVWLAKTYRNLAENVEHLVLQKGTVDPDRPTLVRIHKSDIFADTLGGKGGRADRLGRIMERIAEAGAGVLVILRDVSPTIISESLLRQRSGTRGELRDYGIGAQILSDLGVREMVLMTSAHRDIVGIDAYDLVVVDEQRI